jgi:N-acetylneuraminate synthase
MRVHFIAELGLNHNGDIDRALALVRAAKDAGFDAVKLQYWRVDKLYRPGSISDQRREWLRSFEVPTAWLDIVRDAAHELGLDLVVSVCHVDDVETVARYADVLKVGSYELLHLGLIRALAESGKPLYVSCGAGSTTEERGDARKAAGGADSLTMLHCSSVYSTPPDGAALAEMRRYPFVERCGYSDHTVSPGVVHRAIWEYSARVIELHLGLGAGDSEPSVSWTPTTASRLIFDVREAEQAGGTNRMDLHERAWRTDPSDGMRPMLGDEAPK